ncbi:Scr1 family TA system antitoxin-like transcriptional regulator [Streptomyces sp. NPDC059740]|uniref:Scr1 family TA system antitoxin-like transcriptional regulator n=1 Tax=Streptomyces sp. NPDC059740 TaxID=3346926 RepID=UPI00364B2437
MSTVGDLAPAGALVVGTYLRTLRQEQGLPLSRAADILSEPSATVREIETGNLCPDEVMVQALLKAYGATERHHAQVLMRLLDDAARGQEVSYDAGPGWLSRLSACERAAHALVTFSAWFIPGLLQIPAYATLWRSLQHGGHPPSRAETAARRLPAHCGKTMTVLLDESVLMRAIGGPVLMRDQLTHVLASATDGSIRVLIIPLASPLVLPLGTLSELFLTRQRLYVQEVQGTTYSTGHSHGAVGHRFLEAALDNALSPKVSLTRLREARDAFAAAAAAVRTSVAARKEVAR